MADYVEPWRELDEDQWREVFSSVVAYTVRDGENPADAVAGAFELGQARSEVNRREFIIIDDVPFTLTLFCWWYPFKRRVKKDNHDFLLSARYNLFEGLSEGENPRRLLNAVPEELLRLDSHQLLGLLEAAPIREIMRLEEVM